LFIVLLLVCLSIRIGNYLLGLTLLIGLFYTLLLMVVFKELSYSLRSQIALMSAFDLIKSFMSNIGKDLHNSHGSNRPGYGLWTPSFESQVFKF